MKYIFKDNMPKMASLIGAAGGKLVKHNLKDPSFIISTGLGAIGGPKAALENAASQFGIGHNKYMPKLNGDNIRQVRENKTFSNKVNKEKTTGLKDTSKKSNKIPYL